MGPIAVGPVVVRERLVVEPEFHILQFDGEYFSKDSLIVPHSRLKILLELPS